MKKMLEALNTIFGDLRTLTAAIVSIASTLAEIERHLAAMSSTSGDGAASLDRLTDAAKLAAQRQGEIAHVVTGVKLTLEDALIFDNDRGPNAGLVDLLISKTKDGQRFTIGESVYGLASSFGVTEKRINRPGADPIRTPGAALSALADLADAVKDPASVAERDRLREAAERAADLLKTE